MVESQVVLQKIGMMFLVMVVGWWSARRSYLTPAVTRGMGLLVVQLTFPALIFVQMTGTVTPMALRRGWWIPLFAFASIAIAAAIGKGMAPLFKLTDTRARTFAFLVAVPNWVFLPLPIAEGLYGSEGVRFVLLFNFGAQIVLWTLGIRLLQGGKPGEPVWRALLGNAGIWATLGGVTLALVWPGAAQLGHSSQDTALWIMGDGVTAALKMIGDLTIPLSLLATGAQLAGMAKAGPNEWRILSAISFGRLVLAPVVTIVLLRGAVLMTGVSLTEAEFITAAIVTSMPVAISCTMFAERFDGDAELSASSIFSSTLLSLVTVPITVLICHGLT
jgi:malate permease and related proteins